LARAAWALAASLLLLALSAAGAPANAVVCVPGAEAQDCSDPRGIAVDRGAGVLYVTEAGGEAIDVFDAEGGAFLGSTPLEFSPRSIAVDNDPESEAQGDVYVYDATNRQVVRLHPSGGGALEQVAAFGEFEAQARLDVGPGGAVYVVENVPFGERSSEGFDRRMQRFDSEGGSIPLPVACESLAPAGGLNNLHGFALDAAGGFYLASDGSEAVSRWDSNCNKSASFHEVGGGKLALAVDVAGSGNVFVAHPVLPGEGVSTSIFEYTPAGTLVRVLYGGGILRRAAIALAPYSSPSGDMFAAEGTSGDNRVVHFDFPPPGPVLPGLPAADPLSATKATLTAQVNPEGKASQFRFEYVDDAAYQEDVGEGGDGFAAAASTLTAPVPPAEGQAFIEDPLLRLSPVSAQIGCPDPSQKLIEEGECLEPETLYRFRAVASNADSAPEERFGPEASFETKPPLQIEATWASQVGTDAARLSAEATAFGIPLEGRFEYVEEAICLADLEELGEGHCFDRAEKTAQIDFGDEEGTVTRTAQLRSLKLGTAYRYRIVLSNLFVPEGEAGEALTFSTFALPDPDPCPNDALRRGSAAKLPDCRAYEMVSPVDKGGGDIAVQPNLGGRPAEANQAAVDVPTAGSGLTYSADRAFGDAASAPYTSQYLASRFPDDGDGTWEEGEGWGSHGISPRREGASIAGDDGLDTQYMAFAADLRFGWLRSDSEPPLTADAIAGYPNLYRRDEATDSFAAICPVKPRPGTSPLNYTPLPQGFSADGSRIVFRANDKLSDDAADTAAAQLYACEIGATQPVVASVLPGGEANEGGSSAGTEAAGLEHRGLSLHNAVSEDAERVWWTDSALGPGKIYLRERPFAAGEECVGSAPCTVAVSEAVGGEGSAAPAHFWTAARDGSVAIFSFTAGALEGNLYEFDADSEVEPTQLIATNIEGAAGFSEDAQRVYFTSSEALDEEAVEGQRNIYLHEAGGAEPKLVAGGVESSGGVSFCPLDSRSPVLLLARRCPRTTPDGSQFAFLSRAPLTGYDNSDAQSGEATAQVFLYDAEAKGGEGELVCASCNPSGGRPVSREVGGSAGLRTPTAARLPGWQDAFHAPRALSADGRRLFFESYDALLPADSNGAADVYQWERAGKGGCDASDANYFPDNGGCIDLISSGVDRSDSHFLDASANGDDVFFKTSESLWGPDPGLIDIYDARALGGFPEPDDPQPACEGEACQSPPAPPVQPAPASGVFAGPGNLAAPRPTCRRAARKARRLALRAKRARRAAKRAKAPARSRALRRRAKGAAKRARRHSRQAKRCRRARAKAARGARR
jgi:DNA-binding beta-propeller fold protein YncE